MNAEGEIAPSDAKLPETNDQALRDVMRAVLLDAIMCLRGRGRPARDRERLAREARHWMASTVRTWPFSFESICDVLELSAPYLRHLLLPPDAAAEEGQMTDAAIAEGVVRKLSVLRRRGNQLTHIRPHRRLEKQGGRGFGGRGRPVGKVPTR
jgi:hypothetical protein